jgi:ProP effector
MKIDTAHATIELLATIWPTCFAVRFRDRKPLKVGIAKDVAAAVAGAITPAELDAAFALYTRQLGYLRALQEGAVRVDLNGNAAGAVTADQAAMARRHIERIWARQSARVRARGLAVEAAAAKAKAEAEEAKRAAKEAQRATEVAAGKRKPVLRLPRSVAAPAAA